LVDLENGSLCNGIKLDHICGATRLIGQANDDQVVCRGELEVDSLMCRGVQLTDIRGPLWFDGKRMLLGAWTQAQDATTPVPRLTARVFGGTLQSDAQLLLDATGGFEVRLELNEADVASLLRDLAKHPVQVRGRTAAQLALSGNGQGIHSWRGRGGLQLRDTDLYELPFVLSLLKTLRTGSTDRTAFTEADLDFRLQGDHTYLDRIDLRGDALTLKGVGEMNRQREVHLNFYTVVGREDSYVAAIRPLLGMASRRFLVVKVRGSIDRPQMTREVLPGLNETLQQWFPEAAATAVDNPPEKQIRRTGRLQSEARLRR
jgi:hypothetical protein